MGLGEWRRGGDGGLAAHKSCRLGGLGRLFSTPPLSSFHLANQGR